MSSAETSTNRSASGEAPAEDCLDAFIAHLRAGGLSDGRICQLANHGQETCCGGRAGTAPRARSLTRARILS